MAPEIETSDFVTVILARVDALEEKGVEPHELLHAMMFIISVMCKNYSLDSKTALELQETMFAKVNIALGGDFVVDGDAEA